VLPRADVTALRRLVETRCRPVVFNDRASAVQSIYFDDARLSACHANLAGLSQRQKMRLRWYDSPLPNANCVLEIKWRNNRTTGKRRIHLHSHQSLAELPYPDLQTWLVRAAPQEFGVVLAQAPDPIVLVQYRREHFVALAGAVRLTIDYDLTFCDQTGSHRISTRFPMRLVDRVILEAKGAHGMERDVRSLLYPLSLRVGRCSKYVEGCRLLGLISANL
jgi:hypothetical protein